MNAVLLIAATLPSAADADMAIRVRVALALANAVQVVSSQVDAKNPGKVLQPDRGYQRILPGAVYGDFAHITREEARQARYEFVRHGTPARDAVAVVFGLPDRPRWTPVRDVAEVLFGGTITRLRAAVYRPAALGISGGGFPTRYGASLRSRWC